MSDGLDWHNAKDLTIEGQGWKDTEATYDRLPTRAKGVVRDRVWVLSKASAGISIHFTSNTPSLSARWDGARAMSHMSALGVSGLDLYVRHRNLSQRQDKRGISRPSTGLGAGSDAKAQRKEREMGEWRWLASAQPSRKQNEAVLFADIPAESREYMLYLPLYNRVKQVELGIPSGFDIEPTPPRTPKPIVFYGTSITQGGCASRPGMNYTAILGRWLDRPTINLGFSGSGCMEPELFDLLCELDPAIFVLDNMPNMIQSRIEKREEVGLRKLREARPDTPIVLIDNMRYCNAYLVKSRMDRYQTSNAAQQAIYGKLKDEGFKNLHYIEDDGLIGSDGEGTVDGTHFTDLGYMRFAEKLVGPLREILG